jgi:uncharacterized phage protein (TIGR01671 family)
MRETKFRGRRLDTGEWVYGGYARLDSFNNPNGRHIIIKPNGDDFDVDEKTVGQYIGRKDKNGKEIYKGDILTKKYKIDLPTEYKNEVVQWDDSDCQFRAYESFFDQYPDIISDTDHMVIGNIHDNPEMVK